MQSVFITGANRGIGLEFVRQYLQVEDTLVFASCRKPDEATELQKLVNTQREHATIIQLDVTNQPQIDSATEAVAQHVDSLDILINNAGINPPGKFQTLDALDADGFLFMFQVNSVAPFMVTKAFLNLLRGSTNPRIINISSQLGGLERKTSGGQYGYCASKAALNMITRALAGDLRSEGIPVVTVHPGWVQTDMGGVHATLTPEESVSNLITLFDKLSLADSGSFLKWNGETHPW